MLSVKDYLLWMITQTPNTIQRYAQNYNKNVDFHLALFGIHVTYQNPFTHTSSARVSECLKVTPGGCSLVDIQRMVVVTGHGKRSVPEPQPGREIQAY